MFVTSSQKFCAHRDEPFVVFPIDGDVIFQVFKHVLGHGFGRVIDDHPTRPNLMTLEKWKERKHQVEYLNDRTWPYHGMSPYAMKIRTSVLSKFWKDHISDKFGLGGDTSPSVRRPFAAVPKATFSFAMAVMDKAEGWNGKVVGIVPRRIHEDSHKGSSMRRAQTRPTFGLATSSPLS